MKKSILLFLLFSSSLSFQAFANPPQPPGEMPNFDEMDSNGDGELQVSELKGPLAKDFDKLDKDGSGGLSEEEMPSPPPHRQ